MPGSQKLSLRQKMTSSILARNGSRASVASTSSASSTSSTDSSFHHHFLSHIRPLEDISSHFHSWLHVPHRHEEIAAGQVQRGVAHLTREMMEMQIQRAPDMRGMMDCLPTRQLHHMEVGWRPKLGTWPLSKHEAMMAKQWGT